MTDVHAAELNEPATDDEELKPGQAQEGAEGTPAEAGDSADGGEEPAQDTDASPEVIDEATRWKRIARKNEKDKKRAARELREAQQRLTALEKARAEPTKADAAPSPDDFDDREDYLIAKAKHELKKELATTEQASKEGNAQDTAVRAFREFTDRCDDWDDKPEDFDELVMDDDLQLTQHMLDTVMEAEDLGPQILYELASNPDEARRLAKLSTTAQARAIGRIEAKISAKPAKRKSKAPPPVTPIRGSGDSGKADLGKASPAEYRKLRGLDPIKPFG